MKIARIHSHLNGLEFMIAKRPEIWDQIQKIVASVDANSSKPQISKRFRSEINQRRTGFKDGRVAIEAQFSKGSALRGILPFHLAAFVRDEIDVGVEILGIKSVEGITRSEQRTYEAEVSDLIGCGRGIPAVPLVIVGVAP